MANGSYTFVFKIYSQQAPGGAAVWTESKSLTVSDGVFQTNLGDVTALPGSVDFNTDNIFMGITFSTDAEMAPRIQFTAAAYAFNSDKLQGLSAAAFAQLNPGSAQSGSLNVTGSLQAATSLQAPLIDTATGVAMNIGTGTQTSLNIGRSTAAFTLQGTSASTIKGTSGGFTTTLGFITPTTNNAINLPNEAGTLCIQNSANCGFVTGTTSNFIQNTTIQQASSNFNISGTGVAAVLQAPLHSTADSAAAGTASLTVRSGNVTGGSGLSTGGVTVKSGDGTGTNSSTGNVSIDTGAKSGSGFAGNLNIGATNAPNITVGHNGATPATVSIQGAAASSSLVMSNAAGTFSSTVAFANPTATTTTTFSNAGGTVCTTVVGTCSGTYLAVGNYLAKNAADTSSAGVAGYLMGLTNTSGNVLQLTGAGTGSALSVTQSGNPVGGAAVIFANNTNVAPSGNLLDIQAASVSKFSVTSAGAVTAAGAINGQTITSTAQFSGTVTSAGAVTVQAGGIGVTGNSAITGTLGVTSNVTVSAGNLTLTNGTLNVTSAAQNSLTGSLKLTGGLDNQSGGVTNAGAISGATTVTANSTITGGGAFKSADAAVSSAVTLTSGNASAGTSGNVTIDSGTATSTTGIVNLGTSNASAINVGNSTATTIVQGGSASKLVFGNTTVNAVSSATVATYQFAAPSSATTYNICTSDINSCTTTNLRKNIANESSSVGLTAGQYLYRFANTGAATADVLQLDSGAGTGSALKVTAAANAGAGNALIFAKLTNAAIGGNLLDLWSGASGSETSKFAVAAGGAVTSGTINGQTLGATSQLAIVNTSGLLTANGLTVTNSANFNSAVNVTGLLSANGGASVTGGIANNAGGVTGAGAVSGVTGITFSSAGAIDASGATAINIGTTTASGVTVGKAAGSLTLQGAAAGTTLSGTNAGFTTSVGFANPTAAVIYQFATATTGTYQICTTYASTCGSTYAAFYAGGYVQLAPGTAQGDTSTNTSLFINKTAGTTLVNLQASSSTVFSVQTNGNMTSTGIATLGNGVMTIDSSQFKVRLGSGSPTLGNGTLANSALYVTGTVELANLVQIGDSTNNSSFDATTKAVTYNGTARPTRRINLSPEYPGATMSASAATGTTGTMTSDFCAASNLASLTITTTVAFCPTAGDVHNYYKWNSINTSNQTYDVYVHYIIPSDFNAFASDTTVNMWGFRSTVNDSVQLALFRANGTQCGTTTTITSNTGGWSENPLSGTITACGFAANEVATFRVRLNSSSTSNSALAGEIRFDYRASF